MESAMLAPKAEVSMFPWKELQGTDSAGGAPDPFFPPVASARCFDGLESTSD